MSTISRDSNAVLKLRLGEKAGTRRLPVHRIWDDEEDSISYARLASIAIEYTFPDKEKVSEAELLGLYDVAVTYEDEDGDIITISSNEELEDAASQFLKANPPILRFEASVKEKTQEKKTPEKRDKCLADFFSVAGEDTEGNDEKLIEILVKEIVKMVPVEETPKSTADQSPNPHFIHGRHTCDLCNVTPIVGFRHHAKNLPDFDLCQSCMDNFNNPEIVFEREELNCDRRFQVAWRRREMRRSGFGGRCGRRWGRGHCHSKRGCGNAEAKHPEAQKKCCDDKKDVIETEKITKEELPIATEAKAEAATKLDETEDDDGFEDIPTATATLLEAEFEVVDTPSKDNKQENEASPLVSTEPLSASLFYKWEDLLKKLHELGFLDDRRNVDALEHLSAAKIGVDDAEEITLSEAVNFLMSDKK